MSVSIVINGENGAKTAEELREFVIGLQFPMFFSPLDEEAPLPEESSPEAPAEEEVAEAPKAAAKSRRTKKQEGPEAVDAKACLPSDETFKKAIEAAPVVVETPAPAEAPAAEAAKPVHKLEDSGEKQPGTLEGGRIMIRRVNRTCGVDKARAILTKFGAEGVGQIPEERLQNFVDECQAAIDAV